jgi:hypothetical protein
MSRIFEIRRAAPHLAEPPGLGTDLYRLVGNRLLGKPPPPLGDPILLEIQPEETNHPDILLGGGCVPVVRAPVAEMFRRIAADDVRVLPARSVRTGAEYFVIDTLIVLDALDRGRSEYTLLPEGEVDPFGGHFDQIFKVVISSSAAAGHHVFRIVGFALAAVFVSEPMADALRGLSGITLFECGSPGDMPAMN